MSSPSWANLTGRPCSVKFAGMPTFSGYVAGQDQCCCTATQEPTTAVGSGLEPLKSAEGVGGIRLPTTLWLSKWLGKSLVAAAGGCLEMFSAPCSRRGGSTGSC